MRKLAILAALFALLPFTLAACGGDDDGDDETTAATTTETSGGGGGGGETVDVAAEEDGSLAFEEDSLEAKAGAVSFNFDNPASLEHDFCVEDSSGELGCSDTISGSTATLDLELEAGDYTFYCSVAGHRESGMEGDLTVK
jgi:uncharacterized cupredoxin-like copper-binding protein